MRRWIAIAWHASFLVLAAVLYFFFVLPRWFELTGVWPVGLGQPMRIVVGVLIGLAALPIVFTLLHTRKPEFGTPQLALSLRLWAIVLHVLAGVLIIGAAVAEFWLSLDSAGRWLFGTYAAAAALAVLGSLAFYLAYLAELPPPPPKPLKLKEPTRNRRQGKDAGEPAASGTESAAEAIGETDTDADESESETVSAGVRDASSTTDSEAEPAAVSDALAADEVVADATETTDVADATESTAATESAATDEPGEASVSDEAPTTESDDETGPKLRNRRPSGKSSSRLFRRSRGGGVALDE